MISGIGFLASFCIFFFFYILTCIIYITGMRREVNMPGFGAVKVMEMLCSLLHRILCFRSVCFYFPCSRLLFFFLLSRSPSFFSVFSPFLLPFFPLCTGFVVVQLLSLVHSGGFAVADEDDSVEGLFHQHCFLSSLFSFCRSPPSVSAPTVSCPLPLLFLSCVLSVSSFLFSAFSFLMLTLSSVFVSLFCPVLPLLCLVSFLTFPSVSCLFPYLSFLFSPPVFFPFCSVLLLVFIALWHAYGNGRVRHAPLKQLRYLCKNASLSLYFQPFLSF